MMYYMVFMAYTVTTSARPISCIAARGCLSSLTGCRVWINKRQNTAMLIFVAFLCYV